MTVNSRGFRWLIAVAFGALRRKLWSYGAEIIAWVAGVEAIISLSNWMYTQQAGPVKVFGDLTIHPTGWAILAGLGVAVLGALLLTPERVRLWGPWWGRRNRFGDLEQEVKDLAEVLSHGRGYVASFSGHTYEPTPWLASKLAALRSKLNALEIASPEEYDGRAWAAYIVVLAGWIATRDLKTAQENSRPPAEG